MPGPGAAFLRDENDAAIAFSAFDDNAKQTMAIPIIMAGSTEERPKVAASSNNKSKLIQIIAEIYGRSISDQLLVTR